MSALVVAHPGRAVAYGAEELKRAAHKYGFLALSISVVFHFCIIGGYYLSIMLEGDKPVPAVPPRPPITIDGTLPPIPGIPALPPLPGPAIQHPRGPDGIPIPVIDQPNVTATIPTQDDRRSLVEPHGDGLLPGVAIDKPLPDDDNVPPPIFRAVEKPPMIVKSVIPTYPPLALQAGLEGKVFVKIWVDRQGKIRAVEVVKSDYEIFNEAALEAARQFVFTPAYMNNGPVSVWVAVPFTFKIRAAK